MLYQITNGTVSVGGETILSHIDMEIKGKEKIAIVGKNGAGKTTLLRLIAGELTLDSDDKRQGPGIVRSRMLTVGMLAQSNIFDADKTVEELCLQSCPLEDPFSKERYLYEMEYDKLFTGFGFDKKEKTRLFSSFSGGEQTKISLICLLLQKPDILLLDEPTNHLDMPTVEWLEEYMKTYEQAVVFVSHDRFFLDQVVDVVYELEEKKLTRYAGNYSAYRKEKQKRLAIQRKAYEKQQAEIVHLNALIEQFKHKPKKAAFARSRKTILERMEKIECPKEDETHIFTGELDPEIRGSKWVVETEHLKIGYDKVLAELSFRVKRGQKIAIIGDNGVGKSTFLKTIAGLIEPIDGSVTFGNQIMFGYFDQHTAKLQSEQTVLEHFHALFPVMSEKDVRKKLGAYLFRGADSAKRVSDLSGGEKTRLLLAELLQSRPNLLLLDEPTNHMDIAAKETLEAAFLAYSGTMLFVSHDRYLVNQVADALLVFDKDTVMYYPFGYSHYLERLSRDGSQNVAAQVSAEDAAMIASLKAVPKAERHRLREIGTEEAYADWKLRLIAQPMDEEKAAVEYLFEKICVLKQELLELEWKELVEEISPEEKLHEKNLQKELEILREELSAKWQSWTDGCLKWYEVWSEELGL